MEHVHQGVTRAAWLCCLALLRGALAAVLISGSNTSLAGPTAAQPPASSQRARISALPLNFEPNRGQAGSEVQFLAHGPGYAIALTGQGAELSLGKATAAAESVDVIRLRVLGERHEMKPTAEEPLPGRTNYYIGSNRSKWLSNVPTYGKVRYAGVYPGVDLVYYGTQGKLEYDFAVAPGADSQAIGLSFEGAERLRVDAQGGLKIRVQSREIAFERPVAYQQIGARRVHVQASYQLSGNTLHFKVGAYDRSQRLIIDPVLSYFSYLGGSSYDVVGALTPTAGPPANSTGSQAAAVDAAGDLYVTGQTTSTDFPTQAAFAPPPAKLGGCCTSWAFVTKFAADARSLIFSTYIGGSLGYDYGYGIAVDASGNAFVVGQTDNDDFPVTASAYQKLCSPNYTNSPTAFSSCTGSVGGGSGPPSAFVSKLSPSGVLLDSTFLGGTATQSAAYAVAVDGAGWPYVAGWTYPAEYIPAGCPSYNQQDGFPTTAGAVVTAYTFTCGGNNNVNLNLQDAFVSVFDPTLSTLVYSTLLGDARPYAQGTIVHSSYGTAVAVDAAGNFYLAGWTSSGYLAVTTGAVQTSPASCVALLGNGDNNLSGNCGFVAKFSPVGGANPPTLTYSTYLGHMPNCCGSQFISGIAVDVAGDAYIAGFASEGGFPITAGAYQSNCAVNGSGTCASLEFVAELNPSGTQLLHSTYFGDLTGNADSVTATGPMALDASGNVYISGTGANLLPQVNALGSDNGGGGAIAPFVAEFDPTLSTLKFSSLLGTGGQSNISVDGLALDTTGNIYLAGNVNAPLTSAATAGAFQSSYRGGQSDGFVAKIAMHVATTTTLSVAPTSVTTGASVTFTATVTPTAGTTLPTGTVTFKDGTTTLGTGTVNGTGVAMYTSTSLAVGVHSIIATYGGDAGNSPSTSTAVGVTVTATVPTVTFTVAPVSIVLGSSATLTWSSTDASSCTASGAWTGAQSVNGTLVVTPNTAGSLSYALDCTGAGGTANGTATLTVTAPASGGGGGGGGGAVDIWTLLTLALMGITRAAFHRRRARQPD